MSVDDDSAHSLMMKGESCMHKQISFVHVHVYVHDINYSALDRT